MQNFGDVFALVMNLKSFRVVSGAFTNITIDVNVRQELHFNFNLALALTVFAAATLDVEGKAARFVASYPGFRCEGEDIPNVGKKTGVGGGITSGGTTNG